jgi:hypothetical protein
MFGYTTSIVERTLWCQYMVSVLSRFLPNSRKNEVITLSRGGYTICPPLMENISVLGCQGLRERLLHMSGRLIFHVMADRCRRYLTPLDTQGASLQIATNGVALRCLMREKIKEPPIYVPRLPSFSKIPPTSQDEIWTSRMAAIQGAWGYNTDPGPHHIGGSN